MPDPTKPWVNPYAEQVKKDEWKNPYAKELQATAADDGNDIEDEDITQPGLFKSLGNSFSFIRNVIAPDPNRDPNQFAGPTEEKARQNRERLQGIFSTLAGDVGKLFDRLPKSGGAADILSSGLGQDFISSVGQQGVGGMMEGLNPINMVKSLPSMIEAPISAYSGLKNVNGQAVPATPEEQAAAIEHAIGLAAQIITHAKVTKALAPSLLGEDALAYTNQSAIGKLVANVKPQVIGQSAGGAVYGFMGGLHDDSEVGGALASALAFAPLGVLTGIFGIKKANEQAGKVVSKLLNEDSPNTASEIAALRSMQLDPNSTLGDAIANVDALANSDHAVEAVIKGRLDQGKGFITEGLTQEQAQALSERLSPSERIVSGNYIPSEKVKRILARVNRMNVGGKIPTGVEFSDPFDQAAFLAKGKGKSVKIIIDDIRDQTGLTEAEIKSHGMAVDKAIRQKGAEGAFINRSQVELDQINNDIIRRGEAKLTVASDGTKFTDPTGKVWFKQGEMITDGTQVIDANSNLAKQIAGRNPRDIDPTARVIKVDKQNFQPEEGRAVYNFNVYRSDNGSTAVVPFKLNSITEGFFKEHNYLPNEIVTGSDGANYAVRNKGGKISFENIATGQEVPNGFFRRTNTGFESEFYKSQTGDRIVKAGLVNTENYFNHLYNKFREAYDLGVEGKESYQNIVLKFAEDSGIKNPQDVHNLQTAFYKRLQKELIEGLSDEEGNAVREAMANIRAWQATDNQLLGTKLSQAAETNGMYLTPEGAGKYNIKDRNSGRTLGTFGSLEEGLEFINNSGQAKGLELDGGDTNTIPPTSAQIGRRADPYQVFYPEESKFFNAKWLDQVNLGRFGKALVPSGNQIASIDGLLGTKFVANVYRPLQGAQNFYKQFISTTGKPLFEHVNKIVDYASKNGIKDPVRKGYIADYIESMNADEIRTKLLSRPMNEVEIAQSGILTKTDIDAVVNYMYEVKQAAGDAGYKTVDFANARNGVAKTTIRDAGGNIVPKYADDVIKAGNMLFDTTAQTDLNNFSAYAVLRLGQALKNPEMALSKADYAAKMLTASEKKLGDMISDFYDAAGNTFGISSEAKIAGYLPHAKLAVATGFNPWNKGVLNPEFARELTRIGLTPDHALDRDPIQLTRNYLMTGARAARVLPGGGSYLQEIAKAQDYLAKTSEELMKDPVKGKHARAMMQLVNEHIADVQGIPDHTYQLEKAAEHIGGKLIGSDAVKTGMLITHASALGGRMGLVLRDVVNALTNSYGLYGASFAKDVFTRSISGDYVKSLIKKGVIAEQSAVDLLMPGETLNSALDRITKVGDITMKLNGQQLVHMRITAGVYQATYEQVLRSSERLLKNENSKFREYEKLGIQRLSPGEQAEFDAAISATNGTEKAADILAKHRVKEIVNVYGMNNSPIAWKTGIGRVLGQFGSWGANEAQTIGNAISRGTRRQRLESGIRFGVANAAIMGAGYATGLNLYRWIVSPFQLFGIGPLAQGILNAQDNVDQLMSSNQNQSDNAWNKIKNYVPHNDKTLGQMYIPYSYMIQDMVTGYNMMQNDFGPAAAGRMIGLPVDTDSRSPLQESMGYNPRSLQTGYKLR